MRHRSPTGATPMSTLTALKLERELEITRLAMAAETKKPRLVLQWHLDATTGRAVSTWIVPQETAAPTVMREPNFV
jgi:hypothetical protein